MAPSSTTEAAAHDRIDGAPGKDATTQITLDAVAEALARLRYGAVHLTVHDGKVVQLDVTERQRFT
jgi:hypothetical protein